MQAGTNENSAEAGEPDAQWQAWRAQAQAFGAAIGDPIAIVDVERQQLTIDFLSWFCVWPISTAAAGIGSTSGSLQTPPGWHRVAARFGEGEPLGRVFRSRKPVGRVAPSEFEDDTDGSDLILTRILWLDGLETGRNRGRGIDSKSRYIYIHGTNQEQLIGRPASHGCVRMRNADVRCLAKWTAGLPLWVLVWNNQEP